MNINYLLTGGEDFTGKSQLNVHGSPVNASTYQSRYHLKSY